MRIEILVDGLIIERFDAMSYSTAKTVNKHSTIRQFILNYF